MLKSVLKIWTIYGSWVMLELLLVLGYCKHGINYSCMAWLHYNTTAGGIPTSCRWNSEGKGYRFANWQRANAQLKDINTNKQSCVKVVKPKMKFMCARSTCYVLTENKKIETSCPIAVPRRTSQGYISSWGRIWAYCVSFNTLKSKLYRNYSL